MPKLQEYNKSSFVLSPKQHTCKCCGEKYEADEYNPKSHIVKLMKKKGLCFQCAFWTQHIENPLPNREIINGVHYVFKPYQSSRSVFQGSGGHVFYIMHPDNSVLMSNNVWCQGDVPKRFRKQLPDTARIISKGVYSQLYNNPFRCKSKGCWDRYWCLRYDLSIEEKSGPWNVVPTDHKPGGEFCVSFINKNEL